MRTLETSELVPMLYAIFGFAFIAIGEVFIVPAVYTYCSLAAPSQMQGQLMSLIVFGRSMASLFSGILGQTVISSDSYGESQLFIQTTIISFGIATTLAVSYRYLSKISKNKHRWSLS